MERAEESIELHFHHLTPFEVKCICNGCGGKGGKIDPPEFLFNASCNQHDFYYWRGGNESDRLKADIMFYNEMKADAKDETKLVKRLLYIAMAFVYYRAVRRAGKKFFNYTDKPMTREDLTLYIKEERTKLIKGRNNGSI